MVVPVATAQQVARGFRTTLCAAMALGTLASVGGRHASCVRRRRTRRRRSCCSRWPASSVDLAGRGRGCGAGGGCAAPFAAGRDARLEHAHRRCRGRTRTSTATDCGHVAVPHGDHVDYVHDGHRHAAHGEPL